MATITETSPEVDLQRLLKNRTILAIGLVWGALALLIFHFWLVAKERPEDSFFVLKLLLYPALGGAIALAALLFFGKGGAGEPEKRLLRLGAEQHFIGIVLLVAGVFFSLCGSWLFLSQKLEGMAVGVGLAVFGCISLVTGYRLVAKPKTPSRQDRIMKALGNGQKQIGLGLFIVGALCVLVGLYLRYKTKANPLADQPMIQMEKDAPEKTQPARIGDPAEFPRWAGMLLLGLIGVGCGLSLYLSSNVNIRIMVLVIGGLIGLVISVMTIAQAWIWRETLIGGLPAWRGENGWRIWLCAYLMLFGLGLMFGSFMLARTDIRVNPVLRRVLYGYNAIFTGLLLLAFLVILNVVAYAQYPMTLDWSGGRGMTTISDSTRDILERLNKQTTVYVLLSPRVQRLYKDVKTLLDNAVTVTDKLKVDYISPDQDFQKYNTLARRYAEILPDVKTAAEDDILGRGLLVVYGPESSDLKEKAPPHAFIPSRKLFEFKGGFHKAPPTYTFFGEKAMMTELLFLMEGQKKNKIYFLQGNDELDIREVRRPLSRQGRLDLPMGFLAADILLDRLKKENYEVLGLSFAEAGEKADKSLIHYIKATGKEKRKDIPEDAGIVVIPGPSEQMPRETLDALGRYMEKNGRLIVFFDIIVDPKYTALKTTGLEDFLKKYNVQVGTDFVFRYPTHRSDDPIVAAARTPRESDNLLAKKFPGTAFFLETVRVVKPGNESPNFKAETLLEIAPLRSPIKQEIFWPETSTKALIDSMGFASQMEEGQVLAKASREPIPIAVAVKDKEDRPRLVVYGDAEMASNAPMVGRFRNIMVGESYFNLFVSTLDYLTERPGVGARPKESKLYTFDNSVPATPLAYLPAWVMSLSIFGLGLGMWVVRRR